MFAPRRKMLMLFLCQEQVSVSATGRDLFQWMLCVTVCKVSERERERDGLWEEGVNVDETMRSHHMQRKFSRGGGTGCQEAIWEGWRLVAPQSRSLHCRWASHHGISQYFS